MRRTSRVDKAGMLVQQFIREHGLTALQDKFHIRATFHKQYPNLVLLKYDQIDSPMGEPVVQECRGVILDRDNNWDVVSRPYDKFFNYGEGHAAPIDWSTATVYEKLDGSLMTVYWYDDQWQVASSGTPDASGQVHSDDSQTFAELFWRTWKALGYAMPSIRTLTYMFELMTPDNRIIVPHEKPRIVLHGIRDLWNMQERSPLFAKWHHNWEVVKTFPLQSLEEVSAAASALNPIQQEGFIVVDGAFNRIKVKNPQYIALSHMKDGFSDRRMLEIVRTNESNEFLAFFPEYMPLYAKIREKYDALVADLEAAYAMIKDIPVQKDFALEAQKTKCPGALFSLRAGRAGSVKAYLADVSLQALERTI